MEWGTELRKVLQLQGVDRQVDALQAERQGLLRDSRLMALEKDLQARRARIGAMEKEIAALERQQRLQELERQALVAERDRASRRLYGGGTSDARELEGLQKNIDGAAGKIDELETAILEAMERAASLGEQLVEHREALVQAEQRLAAYRHQSHVRLGEIDGQLPLLAARRDEEARGIESAVLREYERVRAHANGIGVAAAGNGACGACGFSLSALVATRLRSGTVQVTCEHCGRLLVDA